jgi:hypothetical protein
MNVNRTPLFSRRRRRRRFFFSFVYVIIIKLVTSNAQKKKRILNIEEKIDQLVMNSSVNLSLNEHSYITHLFLR